jgi:hypothetical protein
MVLFGSETTWCAISRVGETKRFGYASCEFLESENAPPPAAPAAPAPTPAAPAKPAAPPRPKPAPAKIRDVVPAPIIVREVTPAPVTPPPPTPAPITPPTAEPAVKEPVDIAEAVLDGSCLRAELASYTQATRISAFLDKGRLALLDAAALDRVIAEQFQPEAFLTAIGARIRQSDSAGQLPAVLEWFQSAEARKLAGLEQRAYSPVSRQSLVEYAGTLTATPRPKRGYC